MKLKPDDILKFEALGDQQWSINDDSFIFIRRIYKDGKAKTAMFKHSLDGNEIKLTDYDDNATKPKFSPCGKYIAFIKKKEKKNVLAVMNYETQETIILKEYQDISGIPTWSPDGKYLAFLKKIELPDYSYKGSPKEEYNEYAYDEKIKVITDIKYRFNDQGYFDNKKSQLFVTRFNKFAFSKTEKVTDFKLDVKNPVFSQDNKYVFFLANPHQEGKKNSITNIYSINMETKLVELKVKGKGPISNLQISPCGKYLSFIAQNYDNRKLWFDNLYVYKIDEQKELIEVKNISKDLDRVVCKIPSSGERYPSSLPMYQWKDNSSGFYLIYPEKGASTLAEIDLFSNRKNIYHDSMKTVSSFDVKDNAFLLSLGSLEKPDQIYKLDEKLEIVIESNNWLNKYELGEANRFNFFGDDYLPIDGWYLRPKDINEPNKTILFIHGGPHGIYGSSFMFQAQILASNGFTVTYVNPRGSASYGIDFANTVYEDWGGADFRDIMAGVDYLIDKNIADKDRLGITGWSYGGYMTCWSISQTNRFKAAIAGASVVDRYSMFGTSDIGYTFGFFHFGGTPWQNSHKLIERSPLNYAYRIDTPLLLVHGEEDYRCPIGQSEEIYTALKYLEKEVVLVRYPNEPHGFKKPYHLIDRYNRLLSWFNYYIK
ncbi:MAG: prolyl oligopeptidase family serine peptidase [Clostridia bacterium]